jgi:hypothetical protein
LWCGSATAIDRGAQIAPIGPVSGGFDRAPCGYNGILAGMQAGRTKVPDALPLSRYGPQIVLIGVTAAALPRKLVMPNPSSTVRSRL